MDLVTFAAILVIIALVMTALERIPFPAQPPWLKRVVEALVLIVFAILVMQRAGVSLPGTH